MDNLKDYEYEVENALLEGKVSEYTSELKGIAGMLDTISLSLACTDVKKSNILYAMSQSITRISNELNTSLEKVYIRTK